MVLWSEHLVTELTRVHILAPLEIIIAGFLLYQLLGLNAFAGFFVLILGWPLNSYISKRSIRIQKGVLSARDGRMGVLNELIGAVSPFLICCPESMLMEHTNADRSSSSNSSHGRIVGLSGLSRRERRR